MTTVATDVLLAERHRDRFGQIQGRSVDLSLRAWDSLDDWTSPDAADVWADLWLPVTDGAVSAAAVSTDAYFSLVTEVDGLELGGLSAAELRGVPADEYARRPLAELYRLLGEGRLWADAFASARDRLSAMAATDVSLGQRRAADEWVRSGLVVGYRRTLTGLSCALCATASTQRYHSGELMPIHGRCVPAGTWVSAPSGASAELPHLGAVEAATRRWYAGELVVISTAAGDEVAVTPNHPVLTPQGWVPAGLVREGDHLLRRTGCHRVVGRGPYERQRPALVENVWRALRVRGRLERVPLASEDFHGDGTDGEVEVVWPDGRLSAIRDAQIGQPVGELPLMARRFRRLAFTGGGNPATVLERQRFAPHGVMGRRRLGRPLRCGHLGGAVQPSLAAVPRFDPPGEQFSLEGAPVYAERGVHLVRRLAGQVEPDRVVELRRVGFRGHVYNLQTSEGWYSANSHIVSNCDCGVAPIKGVQDPGRVINQQLLEDLQQASNRSAYWKDRGVTVENGRVVSADSDARFKPKVRQHGELGPVLVAPGDHFQGPSITN